MARRGRFLDWAGESQYYVEPKRLARLGYLRARKEPGKTRPRRVYSLTEKGRAALRAWSKTPTRFTPVKSELLVRLLVADLVGVAATRRSVRALRAEIAELQKLISASEAGAEALPHRRRYLLLTTEYLRSLLDLQLELIEKV